MNVETTYVLIVSIPTAVAIAVRWLRVPYTVVLVLVGLVLGMLHVVDAPHLTTELLFALIPPGLIFEAAFNIGARELWNNRIAIGALFKRLNAGHRLSTLVEGESLLNDGLFEWALLLESADTVGLPSDPEFRSAFVAYLEWGTRLVVIDSQDGVTPGAEQPTPRWGWGAVGGPCQGA